MRPPAYAYQMAERGIPTFPCNAEKKPCCKRGFYAATTDRSELEALWRLSPGPLIGMPNGPASGLDLLDIDPRHGGLEWLADFASYIPETRTIFTLSGGTHFFLNHLPGMRNSESKIAPGVDVRGEGGYTVLWLASGGTLSSDAPPADWPDWLATQALSPKETVSFDPETGEVFDVTHPVSHRPASTIHVGKRDKRTREEIVLDMISRSLRNVRDAPGGRLHYSLCSASRTIGGLIEGMGFSVEEAGMQLYNAAKEAGAKDLKNAVKTIKSGLAFGKCQPLVIGARQ